MICGTIPDSLINKYVNGFENWGYSGKIFGKIFSKFDKNYKPTDSRSSMSSKKKGHKENHRKEHDNQISKFPVIGKIKRSYRGKKKSRGKIPDFVLITQPMISSIFIASMHRIFPWFLNPGFICFRLLAYDSLRIRKSFQSTLNTKGQYQKGKKNLVF